MAIDVDGSVFGILMTGELNELEKNQQKTNENITKYM